MFELPDGSKRPANEETNNEAETEKTETNNSEIFKKIIEKIEEDKSWIINVINSTIDFFNFNRPFLSDDISNKLEELKTLAEKIFEEAKKNLLTATTDHFDYDSYFTSLCSTGSRLKANLSRKVTKEYNIYAFINSTFSYLKEMENFFNSAGNKSTNKKTEKNTGFEESEENKRESLRKWLVKVIEKILAYEAALRNAFFSLESICVYFDENSTSKNSTSRLERLEKLYSLFEIFVLVINEVKKVDSPKTLQYLMNCLTLWPFLEKEFSIYSALVALRGSVNQENIPQEAKEKQIDAVICLILDYLKQMKIYLAFARKFTRN